MTGEVYNGEVLPPRPIPGDDWPTGSLKDAVQRVIDDPWTILPPEEWTHRRVTDSQPDVCPRYERYPHSPTSYDNYDPTEKSGMTDGDDADAGVELSTGESSWGAVEIGLFEAAVHSMAEEAKGA